MALRDRKVSGPFEKRAGNIESKNNRGLFYTFILFLSPSLSTFPLPMVMQMSTQLHFSFRPMSLESQVEASNVLESCITELRSWLISNRFMINDIKTEFLIIGSRHQLAKTTTRVLSSS